MTNFSFDIVSDYDKAEANNVFDQVKREIDSRYDFKNTPAAIDWLNTNKSGFKLVAANDMQLDQIIEIIRKKLAARNLSQKLLDVSNDPVEANFKISKDIPFVQGLDQVKAKALSKFITAKFPKSKVSIQGDSLRVTSSSKNDLQAIINNVKAEDFAFPLNFINYR